MGKSVITSADLQIKYEHLYQFLMNYLWEFPVVQSLANLEIAIFKRFPDKEEMLRCLTKLRAEISRTYTELSNIDEPEFQKTYEGLESAIEAYEDPGCELYGVQFYAAEPTDADSSEPTDSAKRKFTVGNIIKNPASSEEFSEDDDITNPFAEE